MDWPTWSALPACFRSAGERTFRGWPGLAGSIRIGAQSNPHALCEVQAKKAGIGWERNGGFGDVRAESCHSLISAQRPFPTQPDQQWGDWNPPKADISHSPAPTRDRATSGRNDRSRKEMPAFAKALAFTLDFHQDRPTGACSGWWAPLLHVPQAARIFGQQVGDREFVRIEKLLNEGLRQVL
jgi:hypothetical protein